MGQGDLPTQADTVSYPKPVQGRVAHIDADFLSYQVSAESREELDGTRPRKSLEEMQHNARQAADHLMRSAGCTAFVCHLTPSGSDKGGRAEQAVQQEYQSSRKGIERPEFLDTIRAFIATDLNGRVHLHQEADDGMAQANYCADDPKMSVIVSKDKDLRMVPGLHYDFDTGEIVNVSGYGSVWIKEGKTKKLQGWGTAFFWSQCLMGDPVDTIRGLPAAAGTIHTEFEPTAAWTKDYAAYIEADCPKKAAVIEARLDKIRAKTKPVGPVTTYNFLKDVTTDKDAFHFVRDAWQRLEREHGYEFVHWATGERVTATQALLGDMLLLWMRRSASRTDVLDWLKETCT